MPRSPIIGSDSPVQYEPSESPGIRKHMPGKTAVLEPPQASEQTEAQEGPVKSGLAFFRRLKRD